MALLRKNDIKKMKVEERKQKMEDLKMQLIKSKVSAQKTNVKTKEIKKAIARLITFNKSEKGQEKNKK